MKERVLSYLYILGSEPTEKRYNEELLKVYVASTGMPAEKVRLRAQKILQYILHHYSDLSVLTIDKFMQRLVRSFAQDLDLPFDMEIEPVVKNVSSVAVRTILNEAGNKNELSETLTDYYLHTTENEKDVNSLEEDLVSFSGILEKERSAENITPLLKLDTTAFREAQKKVRLYLKETETRIHTIGEKMNQILTEQALGEKDFFYGKSGIFSFFKRVMRFDNTIDGFEKIQLNNHGKKTIEEDRWEGSSGVSLSSVAKEGLTLLVQEALAMREKEKTQYVLFKELDTQIYRLMMLREIAAEIQSVKEENNLIFFNDFHRYVAQIIRSEPVSFIYERSGDRYHNLLLDEFQDTSELQWENLIPLIDNGLASGQLNLIVGDAKQAIYRFRNGNVRQFVQLPEIGNEKSHFPETVKENFRREFQRENLTVNRRSSAEIVAFNNQLFDTLRDHVLTGELRQYYLDCHQEVGASVKNGYVECHAREDSRSSSEVYNEAFEIALGQIKMCLEDGYRQGDITLLFRSRKEIAEFASRLMKEGIKVVSEEGLKLLSNQEVLVVTAVFRLLTNPYSKAAAIDLLLHFHKNEALPNLIETWFKKAESGNFYFDIDGYFRVHVPELSAQHLLSCGLHDMLGTLCREFHFFIEKNPFLEGMADAITDYTQNFGDNLFGFVEWWKEAGEKRSATIPKSEDAVELVTIHKSKGLQYPVVICPLVNWKHEGRNKNMELVDVRKQLDGIPAALLDISSQTLKGTDFESLYEEEFNYTVLDNLNLLYVALTRPEQRLYVTAFFPKNENLTHAGSLVCKGMGISEATTLPVVYGQRTVLKQPEKQEEQAALALVTKGDWKEIIRVVTTYPDNPESARQQGELLHLALERIRSKQDIPVVVHNLCKEGRLLPDQSDVFAAELADITASAQLSDWFVEDSQVINEQELITSSGSILRIDRLLLRNGEAVPLDFKTGTPRPDDINQVRGYLSVLQQGGYRAPKGYIYYTSTKELKLVE